MFKDNFTPKEIETISNNIFTTLRENTPVFTFIKSLWFHNFDKIGFKEIPEEIFNLIQNTEESPDQMIQNIELIINSNKEFKRFARKSRKTGNRMSFNYDLMYSFLKKYIQEQKENKDFSFVDFGCGKMALIRRMVKENTGINIFYGYDPGIKPEYIDFDPRAHFLHSKFEVEALQNIDAVYSSFVFHHLTLEEIHNSLKLLHTILKPGGIFIFIEESFPSLQKEQFQCESQKSKEYLNTICYAPQADLNNLFNSLAEKEKFLAVYLNDVLNNLKNLDYMPWTYEYRTMAEWRSLGESYGFEVQEEFYFGVVENEKLKQGITSCFVFRKV